MKVKESSGNTPETTKLALEDDAAYVYSDGQACMPSLEQIEELIDNCTLQWTTLNGVYGLEFTGPSGNSIFMPAAGDRYKSALRHYGCNYWSSMRCADNDRDAYCLIFDVFNVNEWYFRCGRFWGFSIRPVVK